MKHETGNYRLLFEKMPDAIAYHQVVYDKQGVPVDYLFLDINSAFETMTGLKRENVIGKKVTEVHPEIGDSVFGWIGVYGQVALKEESIRFERYIEPAGRWYDVSAFADTPGYLAVSFREVTLRKNENLALTKLASMAQDILQNPSGDLNYQVLSDGLLELSDASFVAINIYEQDGKKSVTKAISGISEHLRKADELLGFKLIGKSWDVIPERIKAVKEGRLLRFANLHDSTSGAVSKTVSTLMERIFGIGEVCVVEIGCEGKTIGDLIMFMTQHKHVENPEIIELYATQVGFALMRMQTEDKLRESRDQYQSLVNNIPGTSYRSLYDQDWTMIYMSSDVDNITGYPSSDFINNKVRTYRSVICKDDNENDEIIKAAIEKGETWDVEYRVMRSDGSIRWVHEKGRGILDDEGNAVYIDGLILDITERKLAQEALNKNEQRSRALIGAIPDLLFRYSSRGVYLDAVVKDEELLNEKARQIYLQLGLVGKTISEVLPAPIATKLMASIEEALSSGEVIIIEYCYPVDGENYYFEARLAPVDNAEVVSIVRDITDRKVYMTKLEYLSLHDQLTGLYNRHYFKNELLRIGTAREHPVALISADLDGLKLVNDTLGHAEGDRYLKVGAGMLKSALRASDILARVGGDEFALILPQTDQKSAEVLINRIRCRIDEYNRNKKGIPLSISIGMAVSKSSEQSLEETYNKADNSMYEDKLIRGKLARTRIAAALKDMLFEQGDL